LAHIGIAGNLYRAAGCWLEQRNLSLARSKPRASRSCCDRRCGIIRSRIARIFATASALDEQQSVRIYDVNSDGGASAAYQNAVADGAEFVVGPLLKNNVIELANDILVPVPVLTLNHLPEDTLAPPGLYQFALAPEDEAASAAVRALGDGYTRAVALVPNNDWGRRVLRSFATELEGLGGTLLDYRSYTPDMQDFSNEIENLMGLSGSVQRYHRMRANIGTSLQQSSSFWPLLQDLGDYSSRSSSFITQVICRRIQHHL